MDSPSMMERGHELTPQLMLLTEYFPIVMDGSGNPVTAPALDPTQLTDLMSLISGTSGKYIGTQTTAGATIPSYTTVAPPTAPAAGSFWYDSVAKQLKYYDGTATQTLGTAAGASPTGAAAGDLAGTYPNPTVAALARLITQK
ncbi:MAG: hypothetical protein AABY64_14720 [Bdellovibrionota bacterium]